MDKNAYINRDFHDVGTGQNFAATTVARDMPEGQFDNYANAGLVREATADEAPAPAPAEG